MKFEMESLGRNAEVQPGELERLDVEVSPYRQVRAPGIKLRARCNWEDGHEVTREVK